MNYAQQTTVAASAIGYGEQTAAQTTPSNPSYFGTIVQRADDLVRVATGVEYLVERLLGAIPQDASKEPVEPMIGGLFGDAYAAARSIQTSTQRITVALQRLEKSLP